MAQGNYNEPFFWHNIKNVGWATAPNLQETEVSITGFGHLPPDSSPPAMTSSLTVLGDSAIVDLITNTDETVDDGFGLLIRTVNKIWIVTGATRITLGINAPHAEDGLVYRTFGAVDIMNAEITTTGSDTFHAVTEFAAPTAEHPTGVTITSISATLVLTGGDAPRAQHQEISS